MNPHQFQSWLGHHFTNIDLLEQALTHPSHKSAATNPPSNNQRLEFLGDAVLQLAVTQKLYQLFPNATEGDLTKLRARLVSRESLADRARTLNLGPALRIGAGEERNKGRERPTILANAMEAVLGAVYLDAGWEIVRTLIERLFENSWSQLSELDTEAGTNAKGALQELLQKEGGISPIYQCMGESGEPHCRGYDVAVFWKDKELARGSGPSKRAAEVAAAKAALATLDFRGGPKIG